MQKSLHSTVKGVGTGMFEVQIRTGEMHAHAELGNAAHWAYDLAKSSRRIMDFISGRQPCGTAQDSLSIVQQKTAAAPDVPIDSSH